MRKSAKCDFFVNLMKKSLTFRLWQNRQDRILISCGARLAPFDIKELRDLMAYDEMELDTIGDRKTALFLIMSDTDIDL